MDPKKNAHGKNRFIPYRSGRINCKLAFMCSFKFSNIYKKEKNNKKKDLILTLGLIDHKGPAACTPNII